MRLTVISSSLDDLLAKARQLFLLKSSCNTVQPALDAAVEARADVLAFSFEVIFFRVVVLELTLKAIVDGRGSNLYTDEYRTVAGRQTHLPFERSTTQQDRNCSHSRHLCQHGPSWRSYTFQ